MTARGVGARSRLGVAAVAAALVVAGCAGMPTRGDVRDSTVDVNDPGEIVYYAPGPAVDGEPEAIVEGFLRAAEVGPTTTVPFSVAEQFLTDEAWDGWDRYARVLVAEGDPHLVVEDHEDGATTVEVRARASVVAALDERGVYTEERTPSTVEVTFELTRGAEGQWRISQLEDGLLLSSAVFSTAFHRTSLYFPTPDRSWWVPDVRWFPGPTWRTHAVRELLAGPADWLAGSVVSVFPEGTQLAIEAVTVDEDGTIAVNLTSPISEAPAQDRALIAAQLQATLVEGDGRSVVLYDQSAPLRVGDAAEPAVPATHGDAVALAGGALQRVEDRQLVPLDVPVSLAGLRPTALALGADGEPVVVRDGSDRIVRVSGPEAPVELLRARGLVAPSVDRFGSVWSGRGSSILVVPPSGRAHAVTADWLEGRRVLSVRVSPEGARIAVVSSGPGGNLVHVAGIQRDAQQMPTALSASVVAVESVRDVTSAVWEEQTVLALLGRDQDGQRSLFLAGVGGLAGRGGLARPVTGVVEPTSVTAAVGSEEMLVLDADGTLFSRQSSALWPVVSEDVDLVAFPG